MQGLFVGIHCADGCIPKFSKRNRYLWCYSDGDEESVQIVAGLVRKLFGVQPKIRRRGNTFEVTAQSKQMWTRLTQELGLPEGKKSCTIGVPQCVTEAEQPEFVNGVVSCDGVVFTDATKRPRIRLRIRSKKLRDGISKILTKLGIHHTIGEALEHSKVPRTNKIYDVQMYRLDVYGKNAVEYFYKIGFWHPQKLRKFWKIMSQRAG